MLGVGFILSLIVGIHAVFDPETHRNWKRLPHDTCGKVAASNRVVGGHVAAMNSYPWIARVGFNTWFNTLTVFSCGAVLVHPRAVLTAAHCLEKIPFFLKLGPIRFGEHDTETNPDCEWGGCADPVIDIYASKVLHPAGFRLSPSQDDLALIKLQRKVPFSEFVKPICLGNKKFYEQDFVGKKAEAAGWGVEYVLRNEQSRVLRVVQIPVVSNEACALTYITKAEITPAHLCAGGQLGRDTCAGDSGGPLTIVGHTDHGPRHFLLGVVSLGTIFCGAEGYPGIYTRISSYLEWFLDNLPA